MGLLRRIGLASLWICTGCGFSPTLADQFACGADGECPVGLVCAADRICRELGEGTSPPDLAINLTPDAAVPSPVMDAAIPISLDDAAAPPPPPPDLASAPLDLSSAPPDLASADLSLPATPDLAQPPCVRATCDRDDCGDRDDGCGGTIKCGKCKHGQVCGATTPNRCGKCDEGGAQCD